MRVIYDVGTDTLSIILSDLPVVESDEEKPGVILDYEAGGNVVSLEILDASRRVDQPRQMVYELLPTGTAGDR
ncbi:MAG TPA: DUF2283 domain-containing protein [Thermoanaerobaculia bacterium]|jgi:uncharacterized protein YuzE|nr:DUF2283 domain-containing protein [Thermoanaerobaculia bacterium]